MMFLVMEHCRAGSDEESAIGLVAGDHLRRMRK
jgi:hypothetical protein